MRKPGALAKFTLAPALLDAFQGYAFAVSEQTAEDLVRRLEAYPEDHWGNLVPCPFWPCIITSVRQYADADMVVLAGADAAGWPVCMPLDTEDWQAFEARHPKRTMPFHARIDPASGAPELCWNVQRMPVQTKAKPNLFGQSAL